MKYHLVTPLFILLTFVFFSCGPDTTNESTYKFQPDTISLIRNPCMGWGVYDDANDEVQQANQYWRTQDKAAREYASFFYIRWRWSDMEPEEGKYAWIYDENYKELIKGALDRGLKLCFRVYDNGQDNIRPGTPDFVKKAGAKGYHVHSGKQKHWTPYPDDPIFQEKLTNFVKAFAREYDNPDMVDFIDGFCLGWWGECHHIQLQDVSKLESVFDWYTTLYSSNFKKIILTLPFNNQIGFEIEKQIAINGKGYAMRRDGLGSMWFTDKEQQITDEMFGKTLFVGESCWWGCSTDDCLPFASDTKYTLNTWRDVYELTYKHAIEGHFNTLDLREIPETKGWTEQANDLVKQFIVKGGYRFYPPSLSLPSFIKNGDKIVLEHYWENIATGYLPNNNPNWNYKYKPAFALLNSNGEAVKIWIDEKAEPSEWFLGKTYQHLLETKATDIPKGEYKWGIAIVDKTKRDTPAIKLAIKDAETKNGWVLANSVFIQ